MKINIRKKLKNILKKGKVKLVPFVTAFGLVTTGCGMLHGTDDSESISCDNYINSWDMQDDYYENDYLDIVDNEADIGFSDAESLRVLSEYGYECEKFDTNIYRIKCDRNKNITYCDNLDEFREYAEYKNPTYDDVRRVVLNNKNIVGRYQDWILEGLNDLEAMVENLNLVGLYCNLEKLKIVEKTEEEIRNDFSYSEAYFLHEDATAVICPDTVSKSVFLHEVFGHGVSCVSVVIDGNKYEVCNFIPLVEEKSNSKFEIRYVGFGLEEAKADIITSIADGSFERGPYGLQSEQLRVFIDTLGIALSDYVNMTSCGLVAAMKANDVDRPLEYIENVDGMTNDMFEGQFSVNPKYAAEENLGSFFLDYADDKLYEGVDSEQIINQMTSTILNGGYYNLVYGNEVVFDEINANELIYSIAEDINWLDYNIQNKVYTK